jgi:DNA (cytosine-5)-methyltransferase 1
LKGRSEKLDQLRERKLTRIHNGAKPRVLDLFAGAGGLSLGFHTAGFDITAAVEIEPNAAMTHARNFYKTLSENELSIHSQSRDIVTTDPEELMIDYGFEDFSDAIDVIVGGPPCQAFARVGRAKLREVADHPEAFLQDPRGNLYLRFIYYVEKLKPLAILMENVPDALNYGGHNIAEETCEFLSLEIGYRCAYTLLNSAYYGVPQMRERMFLIAYAPELEVTSVQFPSPTHWIDLPYGYEGTRSVALNGFKRGDRQLDLFEDSYFLPPKKPDDNLPAAISAEDALSDLPPIYAQELLDRNLLKRGVQDPMDTVTYPYDRSLNWYAYLMRHWHGFENENTVTGHIIRFLPRDYKLFARMEHGDQYPELHRLSIKMFREELERRITRNENIPGNLAEVRKLWREYVPPYDPGKFPNKWRKMEATKPARTLMAHIGKDTYSHIHYDSNQARTISVREAARLQSFPDGFIFAGKMNSAFKQIGNAVPPLLAYYIASEVKQVFKQKAENILSEKNLYGHSESTITSAC